MWDECGKFFGGLWNVIFRNFNFGTEFVMCQSIPNGGGGEVEQTNWATGHVPILKFLSSDISTPKMIIKECGIIPHKNVGSSHI